MEWVTTAEKKGNFCNSVYIPPNGKDSRIFDKDNKYTIRYIQLHIELVKKGLKVNRIYILNSISEINNDFKENIQIFIKHNINVRFVLKSDLEKLNLISYNFTYDGLKELAIYKNMYEKRAILKVTKDINIIETLDYNYKKIYELSYGFDEFLKLPKTMNQEEDEILKVLAGEWYLYQYNSYDALQGKSKVVETNIVISSSNDVKEIYSQTVIAKGYYNLQNEYQVYIYLTHTKSKKTHLLILDRDNITHPIMKSITIGKYLGTSNNLADIGIFSKRRINHIDIEKTLGDVSKIVLIEDNQLTERIHDLYYNYK